MFTRVVALIVALHVCGFGAGQGYGAAPQPVDKTGMPNGLIVQIGCGDAASLDALVPLASHGRTIHVLDQSPDHIAKAHAFIRSKQLAGVVTAEVFDGAHLPYVDNLVNAVIAAHPDQVTRAEILRVLSPRGVAVVDGKRLSKPLPKSMDEWTHFLHSSSGNAVSHDTGVNSPRGIQWTVGPAHMRYHDSLSSFSTMTSSHGRVFYILDEGPISLPHRAPSWKLIARDAFNGMLLWKRDIPKWVSHLYYFRTGPLQITRRLVSVGDNVFATLGLDAPVSKIDAATGRSLATYQGSAGTEELIWHNGTLLTVQGDPTIFDDEAPKVYGYWELSVRRQPKVDKAIVAYDADSGKVRWRIDGDNLRYLAPLSLCAAGDRVFYLDNEKLHCVDFESGRELWQAAFGTRGLFLRGYAPTVVATSDTVLCLTWDRLVAFAAADGQERWHNKGACGFASPADLFVIDNNVWTIPLTSAIWNGNRLDRTGRIASGVPIDRSNFLGNGGKEMWGLDLHSGEIHQKLARALLPGGHHHRCYRNKATDRFLLCGRRGVEFVDLAGDENVNNWWIRGICQYGIMPANGMLYVPPDPCRCFNLIKVNGLLALGSRSSQDSAPTDAPLGLEKGPAYGAALEFTPVGAARQRQRDQLTPSGPAWMPPVYPVNDADWPTYRGNNARSGSTPTAIPGELHPLWTTPLGGDLTPPVKAGNRLFVADKQRQLVLCLNARNGEILWQFMANGRVNSPPTIAAGRCVFGCADGAVYCLAAETGDLVWRFRAVPVDRRIVVENRLESVWPIDGSVLIQSNAVYFAAGRSSYLDGGLRVFAVDLATGRELHRRVVTATPVYPGKAEPGGIGALPDILVSDGHYINMRNLALDTDLQLAPRHRLQTLVASTGFVDGSWFHRQSWLLGLRQVVNPSKHAGGLSSQSRSGPTPMGQLVVFNDSHAYSVMDPYTWLKRTPAMYPPDHDGHFHQKFARYTADRFPIGVTIAACENKVQRKPTAIWSVDLPVQPRGMVLASDALVLAGWRDAVTIQPQVGRPLNPKDPDPRPALLWTMATGDGHQLAEYRLSSVPVFDGLIAAAGRLYISLQDGSICCYGDK